MSPAALALLIQGIQMAIAEAPHLVELAVEFKDFIARLFTKGVITKEVQERVHAHVDQICADALAGLVTPAWMVERDPE